MANPELLQTGSNVVDGLMQGPKIDCDVVVDIDDRALGGIACGILIQQVSEWLVWDARSWPSNTLPMGVVLLDDYCFMISNSIGNNTSLRAIDIRQCPVRARISVQPFIRSLTFLI